MGRGDLVSVVNAGNETKSHRIPLCRFDDDICITALHAQVPFATKR